MSLNNKTILIVTNSTNVGGVAKISTFLANSSIKHFKSVYILPLYDINKNDKLDNKVNFLYLKNKYYFRKKSSKLSNNLKLLFSIRNVVKNVNPDLVCTLGSDTSIRYMLSTIYKNIPVVSSERGDPRELNYMWSKLTEYAYKKADCVVYQTPVIQKLHENIAKASVVIANPWFNVDKEIKIAHERKKTIVSVGRLALEKDYKTLIKAFSIILNENQDYKLIIYGEGPLRSELEQQINDLGLKAKVLLPGHITNVNEHIYDASVFVLSSKYEGMPNALIEALALGLPTVATNCRSGGPAFLTDNGRRGILVPVNDAQAIADAIKMIINNKALSEELSFKALEIQNELNPSNIEEKWMSVFSSIMKNKD